MPIANLESVSKLYGSFAALRKVTYAFEYGHSYVLLGANGAGKSTLLRLLAGLLAPTYGKLRWFDQIEEPGPALGARASCMGHAPMVYEELTGRENLQYFSQLYPQTRLLTPEVALTTVGLDPSLSRPVSGYSQGMRQRLSLARALLSQPELLLLDEPFSNLDAEGARQMVKALRSSGDSKRTLVMTTHQPELAEGLADTWITLRQGSIESVETSRPASGVIA